jgi:two-component system, NarL family, sensor kinase
MKRASLQLCSGYVEGFSKRSGIKVSLDIPFELERLPETIEIALFRVLQEALTNVHRHSKSREAEIHLEINEQEAMLQVRDHGHGIPAAVLERFHKASAEVGVGLSGMRERVNELGGHLEINSDNQGTLVSVSIPVEPPTQNSDFLSPAGRYSPFQRQTSAGAPELVVSRRSGVFGL